MNLEAFEFIEFLNYCSKINWITTSLEVKLNDYKKKFPNVETKEQDEMIDILRKLFVWLHNLERDYDTTKKISLQNNYTNLVLTNKVKELEAENIKLNKLINN